MAPEVEQAIVALAIDQPTWGPVRVANELAKRGLSLSPSGVRGVWQRHNLGTMKLRLKALEARVAQEGLILTEAQVAALEKATADTKAHGEFESECPGYCGVPERHEYELYLAVEDIDHTRTKTRSPQTNGICERFHKTVLNECSRVAFRKRLYRGLEELQADLDAWLQESNEVRPHQGGGATARPRCRRSWTACRWRRRNSWRREAGRTVQRTGHRGAVRKISTFTGWSMTSPHITSWRKVE